MTYYPALTFYDYAAPLFFLLLFLGIFGVIRDLLNPEGLWNAYFSADSYERLRKYFKDDNNEGIEDIGEEPMVFKAEVV